MFETGPSGLVQIFDPWARVVEDVESPSGVWVRAVEEYLRIQQGAMGGNEGSVIESARRNLLERDDIAARTIADDLARHLRKSTGVDLAQPPTRWVHLDMPLESVAGVGSTEEGKAARGIFLCRKDSTGMDVHLIDGESGSALMMVVGTQRFEVERVGAQKLADLRTIGGTVPFTNELLEAMTSETGESGLLVDDGASILAPPLDVLQKFALRCGALLQSEALSRPAG
jgi:hypothetical protein